MRIVEVMTDTNVGGAGVLLCNRLLHSEKDIESVVLLPRGSKLKKRLSTLGVKVAPLRHCRDRSFDLLAIPELCIKLFLLRPDIVNSHACLSSRIAARLVRIRASVYTRHCSYPLSSIYQNRCVRAALGYVTSLLSDRVIAVSPAVKRDLIAMGITPKKINVVINGAEPIHRSDEQTRTETRCLLGIPKEAIVVGIFARLEQCKDHETFLRAARVIANISDEYYFLVVGTGSAERRLRTFCKRLGIEKRVIFTGFAEDVAPLMNITDINVNCSIGSETSSLALSEGMSLGIPAVASDFGGNRYMIRDGVNGLIYPRGDHRRLAGSILHLSEKELYEKCSKQALRRFSYELNAENMAGRTYKIYRETLKQKNG